MKIKELFFNREEMSEKELNFAKRGFIVDAVCENCSANWLGSSYFVALLAFLGASEATSSFIVSLNLIGAAFAIFYPYIINRVGFKKPIVYASRIFMRPLLAMVFFFPLIFGKNPALIVACAICYFIYHMAANICSPPQTIWTMDCVKKGGASGKYFGIKDGITFVVLAAAFLVAAYVTKTFSGELEVYSYLILGTMAFVAAFISFVVLFFTKEPYVKHEPKRINLIREFKDMFLSKQFRGYLVFCLVFDVGNQIANLICSIFLVQRVGISLEFLSYKTVADLILRALLSVAFGRLGDKIGMKRVLRICIAAWAINWVIYGFMNQGNAYVMIIITILLSAITNGGYGLSKNIYLFESMPEEKKDTFIVCINTLLFAVSYILSLFVTFYLANTASFKLNLGGFAFDNMNLLFLICAALILASVGVLSFNIKRAEK